MVGNLIRNDIWLILAWLVISGVLIEENISKNWSKNDTYFTLRYDAWGYYSYLPAVFVYNDLNFEFIEDYEYYYHNDEYQFYDYRAKLPSGKLVNKYYLGTALCQVPFFLTAHLISQFSEYDANGYSYWYMVFVSVASFFYCILGLYFLSKLLQLYNVRPLIIAITIVSTLLGTNLLHYTIGEPGMSHVFSFGIVSAFLYVGHRYFQKPSKKYVIILAFLLGLITLIRPINILIIFALPFMARYKMPFFSGINWIIVEKKFIPKIYAILIFGFMVGLQMLSYKIATGNWFIYSYRDESFNFLDPHIFDILFSYRKGLFLYTPLTFISLLGLYVLYNLSRWSFISWLGFMTIITYIFSSWWKWYYGGSFSSRVYVEFLPFLMLLLGMFLQFIFYRSKVLLIVVLLVVGDYNKYKPDTNRTIPKGNNR